MTIRVFFLIGIGISLMGCEPVPGPGDLHKDLLVQTDYNGTIDFSSYNTYTLSLDTLGLISNTTTDTLIVDDFAKRISTEIKSNMDARGYTYVPINQNPDLGINAFVVSDFSIFQTISYPSNYGGYYSPYYGYYYPVVNTYANNSVILIVQLVDFNKTTSQGRFQVVWTSYIGDLASVEDYVQKSVEAVAQAFSQSQAIGK